MDRPRPANDEGNIIIRFSINGKRLAIRGIGRYDDAVAMREAELIADRLYADMLSDRVLPDIAMYSPRYKVKALEVKAKAKAAPSLLDTWRLFVASKEHTVCENTLQRYETSGSAIHKLGLDKHKWALLPIKDALATLLPDNRKRVTKHLVAMSLWAWQHDLIPSDYLAKLKLDSGKSGTVPQPKPFTAAQRDALLAYMQQHKDYSYYAPLTLFLFHTGCRPCEAVGLQWRDVDLERQQITLGRSVVYLSDGTTQHRDVSKTGRLRVVPFNKALRSLFGDILFYTNFESNKPVFTSKSNGYIKFDNFRRRAWKTCVSNIGLNSALMTPYSARDTFITLALDKGIDVRTIAKLCDNSPDIIYRHYAGWVRDIAPVET